MGRLIGTSIITLGVVTLLVGCSTPLFLAGGPESIREFGRYQNGQITVGKASPDIDDAYHQTQRHTDPTALEALNRKLEGMRNEQ